jgi:hypothetical protein
MGDSLSALKEEFMEISVKNGVLKRIFGLTVGGRK